MGATRRWLTAFTLRLRRERGAFLFGVLSDVESFEEVSHSFFFGQVLPEDEACVVLKVLNFLGLVPHKGVGRFDSLVLLLPFFLRHECTGIHYWRVKILIELVVKGVLILELLSLWLS